MNQKVFATQMLDLEAKLKKLEVNKQQKLLDMQTQQMLFKEAVEQRVKEVEEKSKYFVDPNNLEYEIERMLNERVDYNYCVDHDGTRFKDYKKNILLNNDEPDQQQQLNSSQF
jgi:hypothetical protein